MNKIVFFSLILLCFACGASKRNATTPKDEDFSFGFKMYNTNPCYCNPKSFEKPKFEENTNFNPYQGFIQTKPIVIQISDSILLNPIKIKDTIPNI